jgi:hypothetical protein
VNNKWAEIKDIFMSKPYYLDKWHGCLQKLRQFLKGWNLNWKRGKRAKKEQLSLRIQDLDIIAKSAIQAPGPNGFRVSFFKKFWSVMKDDILALFYDFHKGLLDIKRLNFGVITLVPKVKEANVIKQYRLICLLNVDYKWITKTLTNRLTHVAKKMIGPNQTRFIKGRNILEGVVILHEVVHELRRSRGKGLIIKIDFEKVYDRVRWKFLSQVMVGRNFHR